MLNPDQTAPIGAVGSGSIIFAREKNISAYNKIELISCGFLFCLFDFILYVQSSIFQLNRTGLPGLNQY